MVPALCKCRYLEKVLPSPYGPRLPWWFPCSRSYWATGDVEDSLHVTAALKRFSTRLKKALRLKRGREEAVAYQQVLSNTMLTDLLPTNAILQQPDAGSPHALDC